MQITIYRGTTADKVNPGDTIDDNGPIHIEVVQKRLNGQMQLRGRRPHRRSRIETINCEPHTKVRILPTFHQEIAAWKMLMDAATRAAKDWTAEQADLKDDPDTAMMAAPWTATADGQIDVRTQGFTFTVVPHIKQPATQDDPDPARDESQPDPGT